MASTRRSPEAICASECLPEQASYGFRVIYRGEPGEAILIRYRGVAYGYLNQRVNRLAHRLLEPSSQASCNTKPDPVSCAPLSGA